MYGGSDKTYACTNRHIMHVRYGESDKTCMVGGSDEGYVFMVGQIRP